MTTGNLPLEIASSLRLLLVGDTGIGKTTAQVLFLDTVPGQIKAAAPETPVVDSNSAKSGDLNQAQEEQTANEDGAEEPSTATDDVETQVDDGDATAASAAAAEVSKETASSEKQQQTDDVAAKKKEQQQKEEEDRQNGFTQGRVSTLSIPKWLAVGSSSTATSTTPHLENDLVPAENVVLYDFAGYGQQPNARLAMDKVEAHLDKQYRQTRELFGPALSPFTIIPSTVTVIDESGAPDAATADDDQSAPSQKTTPPNTASSIILQFLEGGAYAHTLPDACLYFILYDLKPVDLEFMKRIMHQVNLIPVLAKADTLSVNQLWRAKQRILKQLQTHNIEFFRFGFEMEELQEMAADKLPGGPPFALSTAEVSSILHCGDSLRDLAIAINNGTITHTNSDLSLLQTLLLGSKTHMLHRAAAQKFLSRWQAEVGGPPPTPVAATTTTAPPAPPTAPTRPKDESSNPDNEASTNGSINHNHNNTSTVNGPPNSNGSTVAGTSVAATSPALTNINTALNSASATPAAPSTPIATTPTLTSKTASTTTATTTGARPLSTQEEEVVAQVVKLSRATSVMRRSPSIKNFHNGALIQDGPVPSVPPVNTALLNA